MLWLVAGLLLASAEALTGDLFLLMLGGGALATSGIVALLNPEEWVGAVIFGCLSLLLVLVVRPALRRKFAGAPPTPTNVAALSGKKALVLEATSAHEGQVKIEGEVWSARPFDESQVYEPGTSVTVMRIDGATAVVWKES